MGLLGPIYEKRRKTRAQTVQRLADMVAYSGQATGIVASSRTFAMRVANGLLPALQQRIFEQTVSYSLGGAQDALTWRPQVPSSLLVPTIGMPIL